MSARLNVEGRDNLMVEHARAGDTGPVRLSKVTLTKNAPTVSLTKHSAQSTGQLRVNLNWNPHPAGAASPSGGFFKRLLATALQTPIDLDLDVCDFATARRHRASARKLVRLTQPGFDDHQPRRRRPLRNEHRGRSLHRVTRRPHPASWSSRSSMKELRTGPTPTVSSRCSRMTRARSRSFSTNQTRKHAPSQSRCWTTPAPACRSLSHDRSTGSPTRLQRLSTWGRPR